MDLVFSDIHADIFALNQILDLVNSSEFQEKYGKITRVINLGDVLERGTNPKEVLEKLNFISKKYDFISIMGNHDEAFLYSKPVSGSSSESIFAHSHLNENDLSFFTKNNDETYGKHEFIDKKNSLCCVHGGPLDPKKIIPKNCESDTWLYQKTWQRLSQENFEFFSTSGYHYNASSAFDEVSKQLKQFVILCGHQHEEAVIEKNGNKISNLLNHLSVQIEKISKYVLYKKEIEINLDSNYIVRVGLGGPQGYYGFNSPNSHFAIISYNPKKIILFSFV